MTGPPGGLRRKWVEGTSRWWLLLFRGARFGILRAYIVAGRFQRLTRRGWWPYVVPLLVGLGMPLVLWKAHEVFGPDRKVLDFLTVRNVVLFFLGALLLRWINHARRRIVVEPFVDYTTDEEKAVSGLATLLVTELGRLRELYQQGNELAVPTAVGTEREGGFNREKEAAAFLTVSADDASSVLEGAVASDATVGFGGFQLPLGFIVATVNRVTRGPRVVGAVHLTEAGGGPTLTAQLVGRSARGTWRVDQAQEPESAEERKAFLDTMVRELACRMYAHITLDGAIRWKAVAAFNEYLDLYGNSRRTPRDRARFLKQAQSKLMSAVAEDESFDLAYYNLGVIYTQLAQTELFGERQSQDATSRAMLPRKSLTAARHEAARVAFTRAAERNANRWEAYYALAVTEFSPVKAKIDITSGPPKRGEAERLRDVILLCDQAFQVAHRYRGSTAAILDLRGMAETRLADDLTTAIRSHRKAVIGFWREFCDAQRRAIARADQHRGAAAARANAAAALSNLALAYERRARVGEGEATGKLPPGKEADLRAAARVFKWAIALAGEGSDQAAACHFERGIVLDRQGKHEEAAREYERALEIHPGNCEYPARRAVSLALQAELPATPKPERKALKARAREEAEHALDMLSGPFSLAVSPWPPPAVTTRVEATLVALERTAERVDGSTAGRYRRIAKLREGLARCADPTGDVEAALAGLEQIRDDYAKSEAWEQTQIEVARGRAFSRARAWPEARAALQTLVDRLCAPEGPDELVEFGVYADYARALRECGHYREALAAAAECVRRDPLNVDGRREAGRAHFALCQYTDALNAWSQALWLSPSDPYLHYEVAMCHRRLAGEGPEADREHELASAAKHFGLAQELFDGEDLDGEAWMRVWLGRTAIERGDPDEAVRCLAGAEHGSATATATLLLGETFLERDERVAAAHAFDRCEVALGDPGSVATLADRTTIDAGWGDELSRRAVAARLKRGRADALYRTPGYCADRAGLAIGALLATEARAGADAVAGETSEPGCEKALRLCLETEARILHACDRQEEALVAIRRRLRFDVSGELLDLERKICRATKPGPPGGPPPPDPAPTTRKRQTAAADPTATPKKPGASRGKPQSDLPRRTASKQDPPNPPRDTTAQPELPPRPH